MQDGGNVGQVLDRLIRVRLKLKTFKLRTFSLLLFYFFVQGVRIIEKEAPFSRDDRLGWLTFCPSNLGTTVRYVLQYSFLHTYSTNNTLRKRIIEKF